MGIKLIREDLKFFGKLVITKDLFKTVVLYNGDKLTIDAQCALRRCIEVFSNTLGEKWGGIKNEAENCGGPNQFWFKGSNNYPFKNSGTISTTFTNALSFSLSVPLSINIGWGISNNSPNDARKSPTTINVLSTKVGYKLLDNKLNITLGANYVLGYKPPNKLWDSGEKLTVDKNGIYNPGEFFTDLNNNDIWDAAELYTDKNENGIWDEDETLTDLNNNDIWDDAEPYVDGEPNGIWDTGEELTLDNNENDAWDEGDQWIDEGSDGTFTPGDTFIDKVELDNYKITLKSTIQYRIPKPNITLGFNVNYTKSVNNLLDAYEQQEPILKARFSIKYGF